MKRAILCRFMCWQIDVSERLSLQDENIKPGPLADSSSKPNRPVIDNRSEFSGSNRERVRRCEVIGKAGEPELIWLPKRRGWKSVASLVSSL